MIEKPCIKKDPANIFLILTRSAPVLSEKPSGCYRSSKTEPKRAFFQQIYHIDVCFRGILDNITVKQFQHIALDYMDIWYKFPFDLLHDI